MKTIFDAIKNKAAYCAQRGTMFFLPSEAEQYVTEDSERECLATAYAEDGGIFTGNNGKCWWWLRTPSISMPNFVYVLNTDGSFDVDGFPVTAFGENDKDNIAVRPAIVLNLDRLRPNR